MTREGRFAWRLTVEGADGEDRTLELSGSAHDVAELHHVLLGAVTDAHAHFEHQGPVVADDEDGWELRATAPPPTKTTSKSKSKSKKG